ncbi:hypothetical protein Dsin_025642 [Dipteronia sinensis]|uniref:BED-type domain-containing protein n=1 Tax=Dipteronia sinensis TaxID=43782 RepID=A0AAD9ZW80_9ROSI|nr:hypothetical protein Dsin_025642 [Dipteronia sinensis]
MPPSSYDFYAGEEKKPLKSDLFKTHMKKTELDDGTIKIKCNYCPKTYKTSKNFGYGTYWAHIRKNHPSEMVKGSNQAQISRYGTPNNQLFHYTSEKNKEQLAVMVVVEHLPFSFGEKVGFVNYCQNTLNPAMQRVPRVTLTRALFSIYKKEKHKLKSFFYQFKGRVSVCADIWTDNFGNHHYIGVNIAGAISECELDIQLSQCVAAMKTKWLNYYEEIPIIYLLASCFDPRFKLECLQDYLTHYYNSLGIEVDILNYCNSVKTLLYELYDEYLKIYGLSLNISVSQPQPTSDGTTSSSRFKLKGLGERLFSDRAKKLRTSFSSSSVSISELDRYLQTNHEFLEDSEYSIQVWWKDHEKVFPILAIIAKQILGTPVSTVAEEQEFSAGGNILGTKTVGSVSTIT